MSPHSSISEQRCHVPEADDISLLSLWQTLRDGWRWILGGCLAGIFAAVVYLGITPPQYEANGVIRLGQIDLSGNVISIEPPIQGADRLKRRSFQDEVLKRLGWLQDDRAPLYRSSLKTNVRNDLIEFQVRATSADDARRAAIVTVEQLAGLQREHALARVASAKVRAQRMISPELREIDARLAKLDRLAKEIPASSYSDILLLLNLQSKEKERQRVLHREATAIVPELLDDTAAVDPIAVSDDRVFPSVRKMLLLGAMGGCLFGVLYVVLRSNRRDGKSD